jgi:hypothetical protein
MSVVLMVGQVGEIAHELDEQTKLWQNGCGGNWIFGKNHYDMSELPWRPRWLACHLFVRAWTRMVSAE